MAGGGHSSPGKCLAESDTEEVFKVEKGGLACGRVKENGPGGMVKTNLLYVLPRSHAAGNTLVHKSLCKYLTVSLG